MNATPLDALFIVDAGDCNLHICAIPPSTESSIPVTKLLSFDARKETTFAISSGLPNLPRGMAFK